MTTLLTKEQIQLRAQEARYELARRSFRDFLPFVKVSQSGTGMIPIEIWPYVSEVVDALEIESNIVAAKARQIGWTTLLSSYALWHAMYTPRGRVLTTSKGQLDAWDFLEKARDTYNLLPPQLQIPLGLPDNRERMTFESGGRVLALPSTEGAGRGQDPTLVLMDEADRHEYLAEAFHSVGPGLADNGGQLIMFSTVNPYKLGGLFQETYQNAPANKFKKMFYGWRARPGRSQEWYDEEKSKYTDLALFQKEYPDSEQEAFAPARAIAAFNQDVLTAMKADTREPTERRTMGNGVIANIFQPFQPGKRNCAATDTAHGTGHDYAVTVVLDTVTGLVAADIFSQVINPSELGVASVELLNSYDSPVWGIEDNDWGINTIHVAQELRYKRIFHRDQGKPGWHTFDTSSHNSPGSRFVLWGDLIEAVNNRALTVPNAEGLAQFFTVIRNPEKHGRIEAQQGAHDNYPMALAIAWQLRHMARPAGGDRGLRRGDPNRNRFNTLEPTLSGSTWHNW